MLNKFAVVPGHFILATRAFREQAHVLDESDLESTLACIEAYERAGGRGNDDDDDGGGGRCSSPSSTAASILARASRTGMSSCFLWTG